MGVSRVDYDNEILIDISNDTVTADLLAEGETAHNSNGELVEGTFPIGEVDTQADLINQIRTTLNGKAAPSGGSGGGESVEEIFWVTCDLDPNTLSASNFSHTYDEIMQAALGGKMVKGKGRVNGLDAELILFDLVSVGGYSGHLIFAVLFRTTIQGQLACLYINVKMRPDNDIVNDIMIVNTTNM